MLNQEKNLPATTSALAPQNLLFDSTKLDERLNALTSIIPETGPKYDKHETIVVSVIEEALSAIRAESERFLVQSLESDWEAAKQAFLRSPPTANIAMVSNPAAASLAASSTPFSPRPHLQQQEQQQVPSSAIPSRIPSAVTPKMNVYASVLEDLISTNPSSAWAETFSSAVSAVTEDASARDVAQSWAIVTSLAAVCISFFCF